MNVNKLLITALVIQSVMIIGLWFGPRAQTAKADIPDAAGQLVELNQEVSGTNARLDKIMAVLQGGKLEVHVTKSDDDSDK